MLTRQTEGHVVCHHIVREIVFLLVLSHVIFAGHVTQEEVTRLLMSQIDNTLAKMAQIGFEIK